MRLTESIIILSKERMLQYCTAAGCQRKCHQAFCFRHDEGNRNPLYSYRSRLLEYCGPAELEKLALYFPLQEEPAEWRRFPGDVTIALWRGYFLHLCQDGTLKCPLSLSGYFATKGKVRSLSSNGADLVALMEDYTVRWYNATYNKFQHYTLLPQRIVQAALQCDRLVYLTDRMELFTITWQGTVERLFSERGVRLFLVHSRHADIFYLTPHNELYHDNQLLGHGAYQCFETSLPLRLQLTDGTIQTYDVALRPVVSPTGILL